MNDQRLSLLEQAIEPYRRAGFVVISQSEGAITLAHPPERVNYWLFIILLLLFWPAAVFYLISLNNRRNRSVCLRITSNGEIEESGHTFELAAKERQREQWVWVVVISALILLTLSAILLLMAPRTKL